MAKHVANMAECHLGGEVLHGFPVEFISALKRNDLTKHVMENGKVTLTTDFIRTKKKQEKYIKAVFSASMVYILPP
jgi:hypothetical protein